MSNISEELKNRAISLGLCQNWQNEWGSPTREQLVDLYLRGIRWCMERSYPPISYMDENFGDILEDYNIYTFGERAIFSEQNVVLRGEAKAVFNYTNNEHATLHLGDNTWSDLFVFDSSVVTVNLYQGAELMISMCDSDAKVYVYQYGGTVKIEDPSENIKIVDKR